MHLRDDTYDLLVRNAASLVGATYVLREPQMGLLHARMAAIEAAAGELVVWLDDDTLPEPDYLVNVWAIFAARPSLVALGGRCLPGDAPVPDWLRPLEGMLALRDLAGEAFFPFGPVAGAMHPWGAGMVIRGPQARAAIERVKAEQLWNFGRTGSDPAGSEDTMICYLSAGPTGLVGYSPRLTLHHQIGVDRFELSYLSRLALGLGISGNRLARFIAEDTGGGPATQTGLFSRLRLLLAIARDAVQATLFGRPRVILLLQVRVAQLLLLHDVTSARPLRVRGAKVRR